MEKDFWGNILTINLSDKKVQKTSVRKKFASQWLGGSGISLKLLCESRNPKLNQLDATSSIILGSGPLCGITPLGSQVTFSFKSPLTGLFDCSAAGGFFGEEMRHAGCSNIIIGGVSGKPVYLLIKDGEVEAKDASHLMNKTTWETEETIQSDNDDSEIRVASIGPAGENLASWSNIIISRFYPVASAGGGVLMGSKKLKAIAVKGTEPIVLAYPDEFMATASECEKALEKCISSEKADKHALRSCFQKNHFNSTACSTGCILQGNKYLSSRYGKLSNQDTVQSRANQLGLEVACLNNLMLAFKESTRGIINNNKPDEGTAVAFLEDIAYRKGNWENFAQSETSSLLRASGKDSFSPYDYKLLGRLAKKISVNMPQNSELLKGQQSNDVLTRLGECLRRVFRSLGVCEFAATLLMLEKPLLLAKLYNQAVGIPTDTTTLLQAGERILNVEDAYNTQLVIPEVNGIAESRGVLS